MLNIFFRTFFFFFFSPKYRFNRLSWIIFYRKDIYLVYAYHTRHNITWSCHPRNSTSFRLLLNDLSQCWLLFLMAIGCCQCCTRRYIDSEIDSTTLKSINRPKHQNFNCGFSKMCMPVSRWLPLRGAAVTYYARPFCITINIIKNCICLLRLTAWLRSQDCP